MPTHPISTTPNDSPKIIPDDPRYHAVVEKRFNKRFRASPDYVRLVSSTDQMVSAVDEAVREGRRLVVTRGGGRLAGVVFPPPGRGGVGVFPVERGGLHPGNGA